MIVCICGSTRFKDEILMLAQDLTLNGDIVLLPLVFDHSDNLNLTLTQKYNLDKLHKEKIKMADLVYIVNPNGYIGDSTKSEIQFAQYYAKDIKFLCEGDNI